MPTTSASRAQRAAVSLQGIARALNVSLDIFYEKPPSGATDDFLTLARLWSEIDGDQARRRVLNLARVEAERSDPGADTEVTAVHTRG